MAKVVHVDNRVARRATVYVCDRSKAEGHRGQGLLLDLDDEGTVVLTCHHVISPVREEDLCVRIPQAGGGLGEALPVRYDKERSRPERDAVVLRVDGVRPDERPLLHKLDPDTYNGSLNATVFTHMTPDNFDATVRLGVQIPVPAEPPGIWPDSPERYELQAFRLSTPGDAREGISGGVVRCEGGVLGLVHFARAEGERYAREDLLVPLTVWAEGWPALEKLIEPLVDKELRSVATVKRASELGVKRDNQLEIGTGSVIAGFREDLYIERGVEAQARAALEQRGGVVIVGRPKSGKTRLAWQLLQERPEAVVVIPNLDIDGSRPPGSFETSGFAGSDLVILFDDLHSVAETMDPVLWRRRFAEASVRSCLVIATSRDGEDWKRVDNNQERFLKELGPDATVFTSTVSMRGEEKGEDLPVEEGWQLAEELGLALSLEDFFRSFDGTPGWVLLDFDAMRRRYEALQEKERGGVPMSRLLDSARLLHEALQPRLSAPILRAAAGEIRGSGPISSEIWDSLRHYTRDAGFGRFDDERDLRIYRPYLEQCVAYEPSREDIEKLLPLLSEAEDSEGLLYLGVYWYKREDYEQVLTCYDNVIALRDDYPEAWISKGIALGDLGRYQEAIEAFDNAIALRDDYPEAWFNKGIALDELGRYQEAIEAYDNAIALRDDYPKAWNNKGYALDELGRYQEAIEAYDNAIALRDDYPEAWFNKGIALGNLGRYQEAIEAFDNAIALRDDNPDAWINKGIALAMLGRYEEAVKWLYRAWRRWEQIPENRAAVENVLRALDHAPEDCKS